MDRRWLFVPLAVGAAILAAPGLAQAAADWNAQQNGSREGEAQATRLEIRVEGGLDANSLLVPDGPGCPGSGACPGGSLNFSIENTSGVALRVTGLRQPTAACVTRGVPAQCPVPIMSDRSDTGQPVSGPSYLGSGPGNCGRYASFTAPNFGQRPWPAIPPHATLQVNGTDNYALGSHLIHLDNSTPSACQGASFYVPLLVTATDAS